MRNLIRKSYHEAGHVIIGRMLGCNVDYVTIGDGENETRVKFFPGRGGSYWDGAKIDLAGLVAVSIKYNEKPYEKWEGIFNDHLMAQENLYGHQKELAEIGINQDIYTLFDKCLEETKRMLLFCWNDVEMVATILAEHRTLSGNQIETILRIKS